MLDDLRKSTQEEDEEFPFDEFEEEEYYGADAGPGRESLFLGMTPVERMFISIFLFMNVAVLGIAILLATGRIG